MKDAVLPEVVFQDMCYLNQKIYQSILFSKRNGPIESKSSGALGF